jgi:hypothetical protein
MRSRLVHGTTPFPAFREANTLTAPVRRLSSPPSLSWTGRARPNHRRNPQNFADVQATIGFMWQQMLDLQLASSNEQSQLTKIEANRALQLGQFVTVDTQPEKLMV